MHAIDLPKEFQIFTKKREEPIQQEEGYVFKNFLKERKATKVKSNSSKTTGILIIGNQVPVGKLIVALCREGPSLLSLNFFRHEKLIPLKRLLLPIAKNAINSRHILRINARKQKLVFYHESSENIEIRNFSSLRLTNLFSLSEICKEVELINLYTELRTSLDLAYIPHLSSLLLLLGPKVVLLADKTVKAPPSVIFDSKDKAKFRKISYDEKKRVLLGVGVTSILLVGFDNHGVSYMRILTSDKLGRSSKWLNWNPLEELVIVAQRISQKTENFHFLSYRTENLSVAASVLSVPTYGNYYDEMNQLLLYIEGVDGKKRISSVSLENFNAKMQGIEKPAILEGEIMAYLPEDDVYSETYLIKCCHESLIVKPQPVYDDQFIR